MFNLKATAEGFPTAMYHCKFISVHVTLFRGTQVDVHGRKENALQLLAACGGHVGVDQLLVRQG